MKTFEELGTEIGKLVQQKNEAYGSSFADTEQFLKLLFPNGVRPDQYQDMGLLFRMFDKMKRIAMKKTAFEENPYRDIAGYGILGWYADQDDIIRELK